MPNPGSSSAPVIIEPGVAAEAFDRQPFSVTHELVGHPLFSLEALAGLAEQLAKDSVEQNPGQLPLVVPGGTSDRGGVPEAPDLVRRVEESNRWLVLWNVEQVPAYRDLLDDCLDAVAPHVPAAQGRMQRREGFIFISSPNTVTPAHFDPEENVLLQVRGSKQVSVGSWDNDDAARREFNRYYLGGHRNLDAMPKRSETFHLVPGTGVHVPMFRPHWVHNEDEVSISFSITFRTALSRRAEDVLAINARLSRHGLRGRPPGEVPALDWAKAASLRCWQRLPRRQNCR